MDANIRALLITIFIGIFFSVLLVAFTEQGSSEPGEYLIETKVNWKDETIHARSIEVRESGILQVDNVTIIMNNEGPQEGETTVNQLINRGNLYINNSVIKPVIYASEDRYMFRCYGGGWMKNSRVFDPYSIQIFNFQFHLFNNVIENPITDGIYLKTGKELNHNAVFRDNQIINPVINGFQIVDSRAILDNNLVSGTGFDAYYIHDSDVNMTNCLVENIGRYMISIWENCTVDIYPETNITKGGIQFMDTSSLVRMHEGDGTTELRGSDSGSSSNTRLILIGIGVLLIFGLLGTALFWQLNKQKMLQSSQKSSIVAYEETNDESETPEETRESQKALVQEELGDMAMESGSDEAALEYFKRAVELNPKSDISLVKKGNVLERFERYDEAVACYISALKINKGNNKAREGRNRLSYLLGRTDLFEDDEEEGSEEMIPEEEVPPVPQDEEGLIDESESDKDTDIPEIPSTEEESAHEMGKNELDDDIPVMPDYSTSEEEKDDEEGSDTGKKDEQVIRIEDEDLIPGSKEDSLVDEKIEPGIATGTDETIPSDDSPVTPEKEPVSAPVIPVPIAPLTALKKQIRGLRKRVTKERKIPPADAEKDQIEEPKDVIPQMDEDDPGDGQDVPMIPEEVNTEEPEPVMIPPVPEEGSETITEKQVPIPADEEPGIQDDIPVMPGEVAEMPSENIPMPIIEAPVMPDQEVEMDSDFPVMGVVGTEDDETEKDKTGTETPVAPEESQGSEDIQAPPLEETHEEPAIIEPESEPAKHDDNRISLLEELLSLRAEQKGHPSWIEEAAHVAEEHPPAVPPPAPEVVEEVQAIEEARKEEEKDVSAMPMPASEVSDEVSVKEEVIEKIPVEDDDVPSMPAPIPETTKEIPVKEEEKVMVVESDEQENVPQIPTSIPDELPKEVEEEIDEPSASKSIPETPEETSKDEKKESTMMDELSEWLSWKD